MRLYRSVFCALVLSATLTAVAQIAADLRGRVLDASGAAIPDAQVELTKAETGAHIKTATSRSGNFSFTSLTPGRYQLDVTAPGFQHLTREGINAVIGQTANADLILSVGGSQQSIRVVADAPLLQSQTSNIETNIAGPTVIAMPLNTRNFVQLATLAPGVELPPGTLLPRINGGRPRTNEYLYDGISALQPEPGQVVYFPIVDDIQEFTVEANNVPAEFGRFNGGVVNVATRSGSNAFHGSLFEFFRNEDLNARNYFASPAARKPEYEGIYMEEPSAVRSSRIIFSSLATYQGVKQLIGVTRISTIPTLAERQGIFTGVSHIYDPTSTTVVNGVTVRTSFQTTSSTSHSIPRLKRCSLVFPTHQPDAKANNYTRTANDSDHQNQFDFRVDGSPGSA